MTPADSDMFVLGARYGFLIVSCLEEEVVV